MSMIGASSIELLRKPLSPVSPFVAEINRIEYDQSVENVIFSLYLFYSNALC